MLMANEAMMDDRVTVKRSFFGLRKTAVYQPTSSPMKAYSLEFPQEQGYALSRILETPDEDLPAVVAETGKLVERSLGNVRLEALVSADKQFAALQLFRFSDLTFHPDSRVRYFEGAAAEAIAELF